MQLKNVINKESNNTYTPVDLIKDSYVWEFFQLPEAGKKNKRPFNGRI